MESTGAQLEADAIWAAVGNIKDPCLIGPNGGTPHRGTKHFRAGAKVYVIDWYSSDTVTVIGQHRKGRRYICIAMPSRHIENLRVKRVYGPTVVRLARAHFHADCRWPDKAFAEHLCGIAAWPAPSTDQSTASDRPPTG